MSAAQIALQQRQWEELANLDPLYAIFADPAKQFGRWNEQELLASSQAEVDALMNARRFRRGNNGRALDFGCGVGRLSRPMRAYFGEVCGVDISERMIARARDYAPGCAFLVNRKDDLSLFESDSFDFVYSNDVLQHQPTGAIARRYIGEFIRILKPGGITVFEMPDQLALRNALQPKRRLYSLLRAFGFPAHFIYRRLHLDPIRTIFLPSRDVIDTLVRHGGNVLRVSPDEANPHCVSYVVTKKKQAKK